MMGVVPMSLLGNGNGNGNGARSSAETFTAIYRAVIIAAILGAFGAFWSTSERLAKVETLLQTLVASDNSLEERLRYHERLKHSDLD
jgi:hypothetical protein